MNPLHETEGAGVDAHLAYADGEHPGGATTQVPPPPPPPPSLTDVLLDCG